MTDQIQNDQDNKSKEFLLVVDRLMDTVDMVLAQFTSGKWLLTIAAGICMIHYAWTLPVEHQDKVLDLIKDIVIFYFVVKNVTETKPGGNTNVTDISKDKTILQQPTKESRTTSV